MLADDAVRFSVIVPVRNSRPSIARSIELLLRQVSSEPDRGEVVVVDDASTDGTAWVLSSLPSTPGLRVIARERRGGPNASRNDGAVASHGVTLVFIDGDDEPLDGWLRAMRAGQSAPDVIAGGSYVTGRHGEEGRSIDPRSRVAFGYRYAVGGSLACGRELFDRVGGFDENIQRGGSEVEFCIRAQLRHSARIAPVPQARVLHRIPSGGWSRMRAHYDRERGHQYIKRRLRADFDGVRRVGPGRLPDQRTWRQRADQAGGWRGLAAEIAGRTAGRLAFGHMDPAADPERRGAEGLAHQ